ncbi:DNA repair protein RadA [Rickettsiella endosymbiont of Dermanyssus gallinae]|uniref:DNA repair protein RadA n=1 Tax=Rickettsiella endosymbiont of Dermanyssus gallinae TaxID=2856608 RepID=UPI001C52CDA8|nr:DNA repair protein RadA [Rickettsiella endosymbiont of Dermanyssus gallinae]
MSKSKRVYSCQSCGGQFLQWSGQCGECQAWNSLLEETRIATSQANVSPRLSGYTATSDQKIRSLDSIQLDEIKRFSSTIKELDRVLGGGIVPGSVILMGGDPGIGKSTLLLQSLCQLSQQQAVLYITGEESLQQVALRARRLDLPLEKLRLLTETRIESILAHALKEKPQVLVVDSIQTMYTELLQSSPGSVGQVRESAMQLTRLAKQAGIALFLVGHVTKDGVLAGPRVLEHMVDTVLYFEGETDSRHRLIRSVKNRFGAVNELGVFVMTEKGLREVNNPSAMLLSRSDDCVPGSLVTATWQGSRPLLVEVQALVDTSHLGNPRRVTVGLDNNRLAMLLAVLHRHAGVVTYDQDVFINVVGGVRLLETSADLPILLAALSSLRNKAIPHDWISFGEVGLSGEIRPVPNGQERLRDAAKHGFKSAIVPKANISKQAIAGMTVFPVSQLSEAIEIVKQATEVVGV